MAMSKYIRLDFLTSSHVKQYIYDLLSAWAIDMCLGPFLAQLNYEKISLQVAQKWIYANQDRSI